MWKKRIMSIFWKLKVLDIKGAGHCRWNLTALLVGLLLLEF
jgi:hypothetical protein